MPALALDWAGTFQADANELLKNPDPKIRQQALQRISRYPATQTKKYILLALSDQDPLVQKTAAAISAEKKYQEAVPVFVKWLAHWDAQLRRAAAEGLQSIGNPGSIEALIRALADPEHTVRLAVARALGAIPSPRRREVVPLIGKLNDTNGKVRRAVIKALAQKKDPRTVIPLIGRLADTSHEVRKAAISALAKLGDDRAGPALLRLIRDPQLGVSSAAIAALGTLKYQNATAPLIDLLQSASLSKREKSALALGLIGNDHAIAALISALHRQNLATVAKRALVAARASAAPRLIALLQDPRTSSILALSALEIIRKAQLRGAIPALIQQLELGRLPQIPLVQCLGALADARAQRALLSLLDEKRVDLRLAVLEALERIIDERAAEPLLSLLEDPHPQIKLKTMQYLGRLRARLATKPLLHLARGPNRTIARAAVASLAQIRDSQAIPALIQLLRHQDRQLRRTASQALASLHDPTALPAILALCRESSSTIKVTCLQTLGGVLRGKTDEQAFDLLKQMLERNDHSVFLAALDALAAMKDPQIPALLLHRYQTADAAQRYHIVNILGNQSGRTSSEVLSFLLQALRNKDPRLRSAAAWALGKLDSPPPALAGLRSAIHDTHWAVRLNATAALARYHDPTLKGIWRRLLKNRMPSIRANALLGIAWAPDPQATSLLAESLSNDQNPWVRINALRGLWIRQKAAQLKLDLTPPDSLAKLTASTSTEDPDPRVRRLAQYLLSQSVSAPKDPRPSWIGLFLMNLDGQPLRSSYFLLITPSGLHKAARSDSRAESWEEELEPGHCYVELPPPGG